MMVGMRGTIARRMVKIDPPQVRMRVRVEEGEGDGEEGFGKILTAAWGCLRMTGSWPKVLRRFCVDIPAKNRCFQGKRPAKRVFLAITGVNHVIPATAAT
jgi:hypothetical protein